MEHYTTFPVPSGLRVIHPARPNTSAAVRRLAREKHGKKHSLYRNPHGSRRWGSAPRHSEIVNSPRVATSPAVSANEQSATERNKASRRKRARYRGDLGVATLFYSLPLMLLAILSLVTVMWAPRVQEVNQHFKMPNAPVSITIDSVDSLIGDPR